MQRALVLIDQGRFDLAEHELARVLAASPDHPTAHAYLSLCLGERGDWQKATDEAEQAIRIDPTWPFAHHMLGRVLLQRSHYPEAEEALREAIRLDPYDPNHFAALGQLHLALKDWRAALVDAEEGLKLDAEHIGCQNLRAVALTQLGRKEEAAFHLASTLAHAPEDPYSHANQGWNYLHQGNANKALEHFREALRLDPTFDYAKAGMIEALKARHRIYALFLRYFLWMSRLSPGVQWALVVGGLLGYQFLLDVSRKNPDLAPFIVPLLIAYVAFALMSWIASPLFNLLLKLNRDGRYALTREQSIQANFVGLLVVAALTCLVAWLASDEDLALIGAIYFGFLLLPVTAIFNCSEGWPRTAMSLYTLGLVIILPLPFALRLVGVPGAREWTGLCFQLFLWGAFLSGFVANALMTATVRR